MDSVILLLHFMEFLPRRVYPQHTPLVKMGTRLRIPQRTAGKVPTIKSSSENIKLDMLVRVTHALACSTTSVSLQCGQYMQMGNV